MPCILLKVIAQRRNHIEATFGEITDPMELARHGARTFWGADPHRGHHSGTYTACLPGRSVDQPT